MTTKRKNDNNNHCNFYCVIFDIKHFLKPPLQEQSQLLSLV